MKISSAVIRKAMMAAVLAISAATAQGAATDAATDTVAAPVATDTASYRAGNLPFPNLRLISDEQVSLGRPVLTLRTDIGADKHHRAKPTVQSIYELPYSLTGTCYDWRRLWINTGVLTGAFVGTLFVLECLPEDATSWNRAALQNVPLFTRWHHHVLRDGPEWDHDKFIFNYVLHPYAGAAYFMGARSCGFNFYQSLLYSTIISNIGWEFGIEAFMERPSYQDLFITPLVGSAIGECFYRVKRHVVDNGYQLAGSSFLGGLVCFLVDPLNEVVGLFDHNPARRVARFKAAARGKAPAMALIPGPTSLTLRLTF